MKTAGRPVKYDDDFYLRMYHEYVNNDLSMREMAFKYHTTLRTFSRWISEARKRGVTNETKEK